MIKVEKKMSETECSTNTKYQNFRPEPWEQFKFVKIIKKKHLLRLLSPYRT